MNKKWEESYEDAVAELREKVEDLNNAAHLEHIEKLLQLIGEKEKTIGELEYGIKDL